MANEIDVTEEAQKRLCRFSYLSHCVGMMEERLAILKKNVSTLNDASEEVDVSFTDDDLWVKVGECFFHQDSEAIQEKLSAMQDEARSQLRKLDSELTAYRAEMQDLKVKLYAEFGNRVNLDKPAKMGRAQQRKKKGKERLDRYYHLAKEQGFRARSAFKLIQLAQKYDFFTNCRVAVDLCAAPGGWMQVCARHMPLSSLIVGVDLAPIQPIKGCTSFQGDITTQECRARIKKLLAGQEADLFLHDGSPNMGMDWSIDAFNQNVLVLHAAHLAAEFLRMGGTFVSKVFRSADYASLLYVLQQLFARVEATKPQASRNVSAEIFVICKGFKKPDRVDARLFDPKFAFLSVEEEEETPGTGRKEAAVVARKEEEEKKEEGEGEASDALLPTKAKVKLAEAFAAAQKRRRSGYGGEETRYKVLSLSDFFSSAYPVEALLSAAELKEGGEARELEQTVLSHRLTTPEVRGLWSDLKVLGKRELSQLLKWRFKIKRELAIQQKQKRLLSAGREEAAGSRQEAGGEEDAEDGAEQQIDQELDALHAEVSRQALRQQRKATKKQRVLQTKQQFSRNAFSTAERDPELFVLSASTEALLAREQQMVDASLLLTGGETEAEAGVGSALPLAASAAPSASSRRKQLQAEKLQRHREGDDSDLDSLDRMEIDLEVGLRLRALAAAERRGSKPAKKETRRTRVMAEKTEELRAASEDLQQRALQHLNKTRLADEKEEDDEEEEDDDDDDEVERRQKGGKAADSQRKQQTQIHEFFDDDSSENIEASKRTSSTSSRSNSGSSSSNSGSSSSSSSGGASSSRSVEVPTGKETQAAARWFSQPLFSAAIQEVADTLLAENFDPVVSRQQQQQQQQQQQEGEKEETIKELEDAELPQIPLSEKQKRQQKRRKEEMKKAAREARKGHDALEEEVHAADKTQRKKSKQLITEQQEEPFFLPLSFCLLCYLFFFSFIEEVPASVITPPADAEEAATLQAMGALLIRRSSRMDLIDGAYNRYAFNDDELPDWFVEDEEKHNKPELPVTKELMREYRQKVKEISSRPIRKLQEAKARKKKRALRVLEKMKKQAQGIADSSELSEAGKAKAIARLSKKAQQATARKQKALVISRRVGGGKAAQKSQGKLGSGTRGVKFVDRRLKKDKRAQQRLQGKGGRKGRKPVKSAKGRGKRR
ncbi:hypothetical protein Efla_007075 [Eimeria flavescens]